VPDGKDGKIWVAKRVFPVEPDCHILLTVDGGGSGEGRFVANRVGFAAVHELDVQPVVLVPGPAMFVVIAVVVAAAYDCQFSCIN